MGFEQVMGLVLALLVMMVGLVGSVLPGLPGPPLILTAVVAHRLYFGHASVSNLALLVLIGLTVFAIAFDYLAALFGARKLGATWRGLVGAGLGALVGLFFNVPGIVLGPFVGAVLFELLGGREFQAALRAGAGALLGLLGGTLSKLACSLAMIALFVINVLLRS